MDVSVVDLFKRFSPFQRRCYCENRRRYRSRTGSEKFTVWLPTYRSRLLNRRALATSWSPLAAASSAASCAASCAATGTGTLSACGEPQAGPDPVCNKRRETTTVENEKRHSCTRSGVLAPRRKSWWFVIWPTKPALARFGTASGQPNERRNSAFDERVHSSRESLYV